MLQHLLEIKSRGIVSKNIPWRLIAQPEYTDCQKAVFMHQWNMMSCHVMFIVTRVTFHRLHSMDYVVCTKIISEWHFSIIKFA